MMANRTRTRVEMGEDPLVVVDGSVFVTLVLNNLAKVKLRGIPGVGLEF